MINKFLSRLEKVKQKKQGEWTACCPAHPDKSPSLGIKLDKDTQKIIVHCFAGCSVSDIVANVGMNMEDLFPPRHEHQNDNYKKSNRVFLSVETVLQCIRYESTIVLIALDDLANKKIFTDADMQRIILAKERIDTALEYCFK